jgi:hypothetical protein
MQRRLHVWFESEPDSQIYFTTGGLPPINSSWRQASSDSRPKIFQLNICGHSLYAFLMRVWVCWPSPVQSFSGPSIVGLMTTFYSLRLETPQPGGPCPCTYIPPEEGGQLIPPGTGFHFCRLLRLAGLRWTCLNPPPHEVRMWFEVTVRRL